MLRMSVSNATDQTPYSLWKNPESDKESQTDKGGIKEDAAQEDT